MSIEEIKTHLRNGDYGKIGLIAGVSRKYARILIDRPSASLHPVVRTAAERVAKSNIALGL